MRWNVDFLHSQIGSSNAGSYHVVIEEIDIRDVDYSADIEMQGAIVKATKGKSLEDSKLETNDSELIDSDYSISDGDGDDELFEKDDDELFEKDDDELFEKNVDEGI
ncbi:hypothetical protein F0562_030586 [Nyssa sinensis]|uniref:Uncharacterized protein n=1 Tax=Nyssa sinensis TaxID=561372 RepID=A0A5J5AXB7_9ASTE|nr:hypothetical protein F0562_030586 [Nyssa sinensis]